MNSIVVTSTKQNIKFGYEGEDNVTKIIFPYDESWLEYGEGNFEVRILRCGDEVAYTATEVVDDRQAMTLTMTVTDIELSVRGRGEMQLCYVCPDSIKKSPIYQYTVNRSVDYKYAVDPPEGSIIASVEKSLSEIKNTTNRLSNSVISIESSIDDVNSQIDNINDKISEFDEEIDSIGEVETRVDNLETSIQSINGRINTAEGNINENTESISDLNESVTELENRKVTDLETSGGRSDSGKYLTVGTDGKIKATSLTIPPTITVDASLSTTSTNPVQNKVIKTELNNINSNIEACNTEISKINKINGSLEDVRADLDAQKSGKMFISGDFTYGVFTNNFPDSDTRKFNAITVNAEHYDRDIIVSAKTGYNFLAYFYDSNDAYVRKTANWVTSVSVPAGSYFRLWVRENPLDTSVILDLGTVKENIIFDTKLRDEVLKNADDVKKCISNIDLNGEGNKLIDTTFARGKMNTSTGEVEPAIYKYQAVMQNSVVYDYDVILKCNAGYRYQVWWYDTNDVYISRTAGFKTSDEEYIVSAGTYFRLFVTLDPPNTSAVVDPSVFAENVFIVTKLGKRVKNVEENTLSTLPPYILNTLSYKPLGSLSKGYMLMSCDDGTEGLATYTIPMLIEKGVPCTFGLLSSSAVIANETYLATLVDAVTNHDCCVALHGSTQWTTYTESELYEYLTGLKDTLEDAGITKINGAICPGGNNADTSRLVQAVAGGLCGAVFSGNRIDKIAYGSYKANGCRTNMYDLDRYSAIGFTSATYQQAIDDAYDNHYVLCPFWHDYSVVDDSAKQAIIEGMIDYALTKGLTFITMADLANIT